MSQYRTLNRKILAKIETTAGTDAVPVVGTNAFACIDPQMPGGPATISNDQEITGSVDVGAPIVGGGGSGFNCSARLKGSGTGGTAPEIGPILRAAGLLETLQVVQAGSATAGTTNTITLAAGASAVDSAYVGMVIRLTSGAASGDKRVITAYVGSTKLATVYPDFSASAGTAAYSIDANATYTPRSSGFENATIYDYVIRNSGNVRLRKLLGAAGNMSLTIPVRDIPTASFQMTGKFVTPTDVSDPGTAVLQSTIPAPIVSTNCYLGTSAATLLKFNSIDLDLGNNVQYADDPSDTYGIDISSIVRRSIRGNIVPPLDLLSVRDVFAAFLAGTEYKLWLSWGSTAGNRVSLYAPRVRYVGREDRDINGFLYESIPFALMGGASGLYISFW